MLSKISIETELFRASTLTKGSRSQLFVVSSSRPPELLVKMSH